MKSLQVALVLLSLIPIGLVVAPVGLIRWSWVAAGLFGQRFNEWYFRQIKSAVATVTRSRR